MNLMTTTQLRTNTKKLVDALQSGGKIKVIHRSKFIGTFSPNVAKIKKINSKKLQEKIDKLPFPSLTSKEIDRRYRKAMMKKHGQGLS